MAPNGQSKVEHEGKYSFASKQFLDSGASVRNVQRPLVTRTPNVNLGGVSYGSQPRSAITPAPLRLRTEPPASRPQVFTTTQS
jgi:hypothetical protein